MVDFSSISAVNLNTSTGSTPASGGVQGDSSPVFNSKPKVALLNDDIVAMLKCGLDPNNPQDVQIWQNKSETEKNELRLAYLSSVQEQNDNTETVPEQFIELSPENADSEDVQKQKVFGLLPGNWSEMSLKDKQKYMFDIMGEQKYGESWATKSKKEKRMLIEQDFDTLMYEIEPQYGKMNRKDKEAAMEKAYLKIAAVLQSFESESIVNGEFKAALEDFSAKSREEQRVIIDSVHEELHTEIHHVDELMEHTHDVTLNKHDKNVHSHNHHNDAHRYEQMLYKEIAEDFGVKPSDLTNQQKLEGMRKFKAEGKLPQELEPLHKSLEMQAKLSASGKISDAPNREAGPSLIDIIGADKLITKKFKDQNTGEEFEIVDNTQNTNIQLVNQKVREFKTSEEFYKFLNGLSDIERTFVLKSIQDKEHGLSYEELSKLIPEDMALEFAAVTYTNENASTNSQMRAGDLAVGNEKVDQEEFSRIAAKFNSRDAQSHTVRRAVETGNTDTIDLYNRNTATREDALDVFKDVNGLVANSDKITDEIKQFYAQNTIEVLQTPEQRAAQAENLRSLNNEHFNTGVETGLKNVAIDNSSTKTTSTSQEIIPIHPEKVSNNAVQTSAQTVVLSQPIQERFTLVDKVLSGNASMEDVQQMYNSLPKAEQKEFLKAYVASKGDHLDVKICDMFPETISTVVGMGKGLDVIKKCSVPTGNLAIKLLSKEEKRILAIENPHRLSQGTQWALVQSGIVQPTDLKNPLRAKA